MTISQPKCPSCAKNTMQTDDATGEMFCRNCGFVAAEKLEESGPEWRTFSNDESDRSRVGAGTS
ncbi:MAG TPA: TFIIB-type zinc ribbon-containing protein, partial [Candidatus Nitrosotenuis sp.]|nr:TFIIB-type zinc ribbon-containing protein [Candidatus Nitrosotenuis sp.]